MILHDKFRAVSRFPRYISCYITESGFPLGQCRGGQWALALFYVPTRQSIPWRNTLKHSDWQTARKKLFLNFCTNTKNPEHFYIIDYSLLNYPRVIHRTKLFWTLTRRIRTGIAMIWSRHIDPTQYAYLTIAGGGAGHPQGLSHHKPVQLLL